jgi:hypothetical protein
MFMSMFPGTQAARARLGHARAIARGSERVQFNVGGGFSVAIVKLRARNGGPAALQVFGMMQLCR